LHQFWVDLDQGDVGAGMPYSPDGTEAVAGVNTMGRKALGPLAAALGLIGLLAGNLGAAEGTTVNVSLWDKGRMADRMIGMLADMPAGMGMGMGMDGAMNGMGMAAMGIQTDVTTVPAGEVTFVAVNKSAGMVHEMLVAPVPADGQLLPYDPDNYSVNEEASGDLGEVSELDPGASGALTLTLEPGTYILYCNVPGHYILGMWTTITVTG
jgi:uncharacterized cupredoxin-like copper-binding protein